LRYRYCKTFGLNPATENVTLQDLINFQAWWNYETKNQGWDNTMLHQGGWKLSQTLDQNYLSVIADLLRILAYQKTDLDKVYNHIEFGVLRMLYPDDTVIDENVVAEHKRKILSAKKPNENKQQCLQMY
jgi:hypothetical protein